MSREKIRLCGCISIWRDILPILDNSYLVGWTGVCCQRGSAYRTPFLPGYGEFFQPSIEEHLPRIRRLGLRIYRGKRHITISDGIYNHRFYLDINEEIPVEKTIYIEDIKLLLPTLNWLKHFIKTYGVGKRNIKYIETFYIDFI